MQDSPTIAIIHGWAEGKWLSKKFVEALQGAGFRVVSDPYDADIIFAHSLGSYRIPKDVRAKLIVLVGVPYIKNRSLPVAAARKMRREARYHRGNRENSWWYRKLLHGLVYIIVDPYSHYYLLTHRKPNHLPDTAHRTVMVIHPADDAFMPGSLEAEHGYVAVEIPGLHDDCWTTPEPYIQAIQSQL